MKIWISKNGQNLGEFELPEVYQMLIRGQIAQDDLAWQDGLSDWVPVGTLPCVSAGSPPRPTQSQLVINSLGTNPFLWFFYSLKNYANFKGRARRREWWSFWFMHSIPYIPMALVSGFIDTSHGPEISTMQSMFFLLIVIFTIVYWLAMITPFLSVTTRRLHDIGMSAWWLLLVFTPCIGGLFLTVCAFIPGKKLPNKYGDLPSL
jgi:uncharacterized membrane protein YhaH (DUF805 family)